jgi:hypothetical protein
MYKSHDNYAVIFFIAVRYICTSQSLVFQPSVWFHTNIKLELLRVGQVRIERFLRSWLLTVHFSSICHTLALPEAQAVAAARA